MNCNIVKDLIPLYIDGCCSEESEKVVKEHIDNCDECKKLFDDMKAPSNMVISKAPKKFSKLNDWKASMLQSVLLFLSFALITVGVALEAATPSGFMNGFGAFNIVVPATGFMLSLANWYFVRVYKNRKCFSISSFVATLVITIGAHIWSGFHYEMSLFDIFMMQDDALDILCVISFFFGIGILLTVVFCILSLTLSNLYAKMLGKE